MSSGSTGDELGDDVGGVIQVLTVTVVAHRRPWIGVTRRFLHVTKRNTGSLPVSARPATRARSAGSMLIDPFTVDIEEDRTFQPLGTWDRI